jgi:hypothetical protein
MATSNITVTNGNVVLKQGTTAELRYVLKDNNGVPIDIPGWIVRMHIRQSHDATSVVIEKTTAASTITVDGASGQINIPFAPANTSAIKFTGAELECVYDVEVEDLTGAVTRIAEGSFTISREVTRT